jgi:hypothetical protein
MNLDEVNVSVTFVVNTWYISYEVPNVIVREYPTPGCMVVRTTLYMDDFTNPKLFKNNKAIWAFATTIGKEWDGKE